MKNQTNHKAVPPVKIRILFNQPPAPVKEKVQLRPGRIRVLFE